MCCKWVTLYIHYINKDKRPHIQQIVVLRHLMLTSLCCFDLLSVCFSHFNKVSLFLFSCVQTDLEWISKVRVNTQAVLKRAQFIQRQKIPKKQWQVSCAVSCVLGCCGA